MNDKNKANLIISILFILIIFLPLGLQAFPRLKSSAQFKEKRILSEKPKISFNSISAFPKSVENYFNDTFLLRNFFINLSSVVKLKTLKSSNSSKVLIGKEGWLFYNGEEAQDGATISNHLGLLPYGYEDIFKSYKSNLEAKQKYLERMGITYLFVISPDKSSIYPEYLPKGYSNTSRKSNTDLLVEYLKTNSTVPVLDLRQPLIAMKNVRQPLYYKNDTHWNNLGAYFAYQAISNHLSKKFPSIKPRRLEDFSIQQLKTDIPGGLGEMIALTEYDDVEYILTPTIPFSYFHRGDADSERNPQIYYKTAGNQPNAIVFRDSFMQAVEPYLSDDFNYIVYLWMQWRTTEDIQQWLATAKPSVVIEERVERYLLPGVIF